MLGIFSNLWKSWLSPYVRTGRIRFMGLEWDAECVFRCVVACLVFWCSGEEGFVLSGCLFLFFLFSR